MIEAQALSVRGYLAFWQGNYEQTLASCEEAILLNEKTGDQYNTLWAHIIMAYAVLRQGDIQQAREKFADSVRGLLKANLMIGLVFAIEGLASLIANHEQAERAAQLFAWADVMRDRLGDHRPPVETASVEKDLALIHSKVDAAEFTHLSSEGCTMTVEQAIALALEA
jgi:tetratricopeptide (TPR) repeat protein